MMIQIVSPMLHSSPEPSPSKLLNSIFLLPVCSWQSKLFSHSSQNFPSFHPLANSKATSHFQVLVTAAPHFQVSKVSFTFYCCYNKLPHTCWLNTTEMYFPTTLQVSSPPESHQDEIRSSRGQPIYLLCPTSRGPQFLGSWPTPAIIQALLSFFTVTTPSAPQPSWQRAHGIRLVLPGQSG